jgi:DNA-binding transcriptional regulator YiaG
MSSDTTGVVSLALREAYKPDFRSLASGQVRATREKLGLDHEEFAAHLTSMLGWAVQPGVVARWERGEGTPPGDVVKAAEVAAQSGPDDPEPSGVMPYADRGLISRQQWNGMIAGSQEFLWLYGMAELGYAEDDETPVIISAAAEAGCEVRVLLLDPAYPGIPDIDAAEGNPPGTLAARIGASLARFSRIRQASGGQMQLRVYGTHPTVSVVRGDDEMLITHYMRSFAGSNSPTIGATASSAPRMFARYARHFAAAWDGAREAA